MKKKIQEAAKALVSFSMGLYSILSNVDKSIILHLCLQVPFFLCSHKHEYNIQANGI